MTRISNGNNKYDIRLTDEMVEDSNISVISEAKTTKNRREQVDNQLIPMFEHMLKYIYQPERQSNSWINTIKRVTKQNVIKYIEYNDDRRYFTEAHMLDLIQQGAEKASKDMKPEKDVSVEYMMTHTAFNDWLDIDILIYSDYIDQFLIRYAQNREAKESLKRLGVI